MAGVADIDIAIFLAFGFTIGILCCPDKIFKQGRGINILWKRGLVLDKHK